MKKSIFLFFAAILCAIGMNAAVPSKLYLDASEWGYSDARYAAYFMPQNSFVDMTKATGEVSVFEVAVPASQTKVIFVRMNGATTENNWNNGTKWNQTGDLTIPTDGKNKFKPSGWDGATTTWSTYTYTPPTFYIAGDFVTPNWDPAAAANKMDYADGVFSKSYNGVAASAHQFKITDGDWSGAIGYNQNTCSGTNCTVEGNGENIQFTPLAEGTVTITYTIADGKVHITCPEPPAAEFNITYPATQTNYTLVAGLAKAQAGTEVSFTATPADGYVLNVTYNGNAITGNNNVYAFMMPAADVTIAIEAVAATTLYYVDHNSWGNANAYMWNDSGNNGWPGAAMALVGTVGDNAYSYYSISFAQGAYTSIIFNGGGTQTGDLTINTAKPYFYDGEWYTWDDLLAKLAAPVVTYDYYITGSFNSNNPKKAENGMTLDGTVYKATVTLAEGDNTLKVTDGTWDNTWGANELGAAYKEVSNPNDYNNIKITLAAEKTITVIFDATAGKIIFEGLTPYVAPLTYTVTVPAGTEKCFIAGAMNGWTFQEMTATANANEFTIEIAGARETDEYKYACQANWDYAEVIEGGGNRTRWAALDNVTAWNAPTPVTYTVAGDNAAAFGTTWDPTNAANDMVLEGDLYKWTKTNVALSANTEIKFQVVKNHDWSAGQWPGSGNDWVLNTITEDGLYTITITFKEDDKTINATANKTGEVVTKDFSNQPAILYFHPSFHWTSDYAQFAAYFYNNGPGADATPTWVNMTDANSDGIYEVANAKQHEYVIICRMNPDRTENNWDDDKTWNQIESCITIPNTAGDLNTCLAFWTNCQGDVPTSECTWVAPTPLTDKNWGDFIAAYNGKTINAVVERSFKSGQYHTLCLPFDIPTNWLGEGTKAYQLTSIVANNTGDKLSLNATLWNTIVAGQPYIIVPVKGSEYEHVIINGVTVKNASAGTNVASGDGYKATLKAVTATNGTQTDGANEYYVGANDGKLYNAVVDKLGLRAIIELTTTGGQPLPAKVRAYVAAEENEATGFENIVAPEGQALKVIENGQLIIIRGNEKFNAQGVRL